MCPRQDSNLRSRLRRAVLYPLSYGGRSYGQKLSALSETPRTPYPPTVWIRCACGLSRALTCGFG